MKLPTAEYNKSDCMTGEERGSFENEDQRPGRGTQKARGDKVTAQSEIEECRCVVDQRSCERGEACDDAGKGASISQSDSISVF